MGDLGGQGTPRARRAAGGAAQGGAFLLYGGFGVNGTVAGSDVGADLWRFDGAWSGLGEGPYPARYPALCPMDGDLYFFGGCGYRAGRVTFESGLWRLTAEGWEEMPAAGEVPAGRYTSALAPGGDGLVMFGGNSQDAFRANTYYGDLWTFSPGAGCWRRLHGPEAGPGPRYGFGWSAAGGRLWLFGGFDGMRDRGDLWTLDLATLAWTLLVPDGEGVGPAPRYCPALGGTGRGLALFGGRSKLRPKENLADTWVWDRGWTLLDDPGPGYHAKPAFASDGEALWVFGGEGPHGHVSDLWRLDQGGWRRLTECRDDDPQLW